MKRITILGAGAIGCALAASWAGRGAHVRLFARPERAEALAGGVTLALQGVTEDVSAEAMGLTSDPAALDADLVVVTTKATAIESVAHTLGGRDCRVLSLVNGPTSARALGDRLRRVVYQGMVPWNATWRAPTLLQISGAGDIVVERAAALDALLAVASISHIPAEDTDKIEDVLWGKLLLNLVNPVNALSGLPLDQMLADRIWRKQYRAAYAEALGVLRAANITPARVTKLPPRVIPCVLNTPDWLFRSVFLPMQNLRPGAQTSMAQDFAAGRATEIDWLNGAVVALAKNCGKQAPINADLVAQIKREI